MWRTDWLERPRCWERLKAGGDDRGWDSGMASLTQRIWVWVNSGSWQWTARPGVLQSMGLQKVRHDWVTELIDLKSLQSNFVLSSFFITGFGLICYIFLSSHQMTFKLERFNDIQTVSLEKTPESLPRDKTKQGDKTSKEIKPVNIKRNQSWILWILKGMMLMWKLQYFDHLMRTADYWKVPDAGKDWGQKKKRSLEDEMAGWYHWCNGHELGQTLGDGGQEGLVCYSPWGCEESDMTGWLDNNKIKNMLKVKW